MGETSRFDVAIVGAGLAGLVAARQLKRAGLTVCVLEGRDRVGGRTLNAEIAAGEDGRPGTAVELGGQWFAPQHRRALALIEELGLETFPTYCAGDNIFERRGRIRRYRGSIPKVNPLGLAETGLAIARINRLARKVSPTAPWLAPRAERWDAETFASWLARNTRFGVTRDLMRLATQAVWAAEPEDISMLHLLFYINAAGSLEALIDTEGGAQDRRLVGGSQLISLRLADELGDAVRLEHAVRSVRHGAAVPGGGVEIGWERASEGADAAAAADRGQAPAADRSRASTGAERGVLRAAQVVFAMSPTLIGRIHYDPALTAQRDGLTQRMAQGNVVKCMAVYEEPFWRAEGLSGQATSADGPVSVTFDNSPPGVGGHPADHADGGTGVADPVNAATPTAGPGVLLAFLEGRAARAAAGLPEDERRRIVLGCLERFFGPRATRPIQYLDKAWANDPFSAGCYGGFFPPGAWLSHGPALRAPIGPLHWAGAETSTSWAGYMEGAICSGERAAAQVLAAT